MIEKSFEEKVLGGVEALQESHKSLGNRVDGFEKKLVDLEEAKKAINDVAKAVTDFRRQQMEIRAQMRSCRPGEVTPDCAKAIASVVYAQAMKQGRVQGSEESQRHLSEVIKGVLGDEILKTALSSSDIPLWADYGSQVAELVAQYGAARRYGTVVPLGALTSYLPRLKTDTAFGLLSIATAVTEKSPQIENVTFTAYKWGGMVRLPSEIDADSLVPMGQFLARYCARQFAKIEDTVFFTADGTGTYSSLKGLTLMVAAANNNKLLTMGVGKTKPSDATLTNLRNLRAVVDAAALRGSAYYFNPTWEQHLAGLNNDKVTAYMVGPNGATLDGFPVRWVDVLPVWSSADAASTIFGLFGDVSFEYLGIRGAPTVATSTEAGFTTDEILVRAIERFTIGNMATGAVAGISTSAA